MKRIAILLAIVGSLTIATGSVFAGSTTLQKFGTGNVTIGSDGASATIVNPSAAHYGGVYLKSKSQAGKPLSQVVFGFTSTSESAVGGGAPRFSLPIDTDGNGKTDNGYAFIDVNNSGGVAGIPTDVSTENPASKVFFAGELYANWATFAADHPTWRTAPGAIPFIIADGSEGTFEVENIVLR